jgi:predicted nicotinamide N-methyase
MLNKKKDLLDYGIRVFRSRHKKIRELKRIHSPSLHGFRVWPSSWLLIDYFKQCGFTRGSRVLDIGCGWGLAGIYCAKNHKSTVTCMDSDSAVFPYVRLHADINNVDITTMETRFEGLTVVNMKNFEIIIGADICFWDNMFETLKRLVLRALESGVKTVVLSDPGREPFEKLGKYFTEEGNGKIMNWAVTRPHSIQGRILRIKCPE